MVFIPIQGICEVQMVPAFDTWILAGRLKFKDFVKLKDEQFSVSFDFIKEFSSFLSLFVNQSK